MSRKYNLVLRYDSVFLLFLKLITTFFRIDPGLKGDSSGRRVEDLKLPR